VYSCTWSLLASSTAYQAGVDIAARQKSWIIGKRLEKGRIGDQRAGNLGFVQRFT
jgi:hypothetical protein